VKCLALWRTSGFAPIFRLKKMHFQLSVGQYWLRLKLNGLRLKAEGFCWEVTGCRWKAKGKRLLSCWTCWTWLASFCWKASGWFLPFLPVSSTCLSVSLRRGSICWHRPLDHPFYKTGNQENPWINHSSVGLADVEGFFCWTWLGLADWLDWAGALRGLERLCVLGGRVLGFKCYAYVKSYKHCQ